MAAQDLRTLLALRKLAEQLTLVQNLWYHDQSIVLDGYRFVNCRFDDCTLITHNGDFTLSHCFLSDGTRIGYGPNILKAIRLYNIRDGEGFPAEIFVAQRHEDQTITIET